MKELSKKFAQQSFDTNVCVEHIIWIAGQQGGQSGAFEELLYDAQSLLMSTLGITEDEADELADDAEGAVGELNRRGFNGFFVQLSTPVPHVDEDGELTFYGLRQSKWFYVESMDEVPELAAKFQEAVISKAKAKAGQ